MDTDKKINQSDNKQFNCTECDYQTSVKSNLIRHIKAKHRKNEQKQKIISKEEIEKLANKSIKSSGDSINDKNDKVEEIELEDYITDKVKELMKANNLPDVKVSKNLLRSCFSGTVPSFLVGSFLGFILSNYIPMLLMSLKKKTSVIAPPTQSPLPSPPPPPTKSDTMPSVPLTDP